ncbi:uncharacterized protein ACWYII_018506 [Salvelinus alpinus]
MEPELTDQSGLLHIGQILYVSYSSGPGLQRPETWHRPGHSVQEHGGACTVAPIPSLSSEITMDRGHFGLWSDEGLIHWQSQRCDTFDNDVLASEDFLINDLEVWAIS